MEIGTGHQVQAQAKPMPTPHQRSINNECPSSVPVQLDAPTFHRERPLLVADHQSRFIA